MSIHFAAALPNISGKFLDLSSRKRGSNVPATGISAPNGNCLKRKIERLKGGDIVSTSTLSERLAPWQGRPGFRSRCLTFPRNTGVQAGKTTLYREVDDQGKPVGPHQTVWDHVKG